MINSNEEVVNRYRYTPYGDSEVKEEQVYNPYQYTGRRFDEESGLYYYRARMYSPEQKRFTSSDPAGMMAGPNRYAYAGNNPINARDPSGMFPNIINMIDGGGGGSTDEEESDAVSIQVGSQSIPTMTGSHGTGTSPGKYEGILEKEGARYDIGTPETDFNIIDYLVSLFSSSNLKNQLPDYEKKPGKIIFQWSASEAVAICNNFQDAGTACSGISDPKTQSLCFAALAVGSLPFCICGYYGGGIKIKVDMFDGIAKSISCNNFNYPYSYDDTGHIGMPNPPHTP